MPEWFQEGGVIMWPILVATLLAVALALLSWWRLRRAPGGHDPVLETRIDAVLFWGGWAAVVGVLGTLVGIAQAAGAIVAVGNAPAGLVWGGIRVALVSTVAGLLVFALALLAWFGLRVRYRRRELA